MARTSITKITVPGAYATSGTVLTFTAADATNGNQFAAGGNDLVIVHNTDTVAHTVTVSSSADPYGRTGDIDSYSVPAGGYAIFGPFPVLGWRQTDGNIYITADSTTVEIAVVAL